MTLSWAEALIVAKNKVIGKDRLFFVRKGYL